MMNIAVVVPDGVNPHWRESGRGLANQTPRRAATPRLVALRLPYDPGDEEHEEREAPVSVAAAFDAYA